MLILSLAVFCLPVMANAPQSLIQYPSGRVVGYCYDAAGKPKDARKGGVSSGAEKYADQVSYAPHGAISSMQTTVVAGVSTATSWSYNNRLQPTQIEVVRSGASKMKLNYEYCAGGGSCTDNNGNILKQQITRGGGSPIVQNYTYDSLNRLRTFSEAGGWGQTYVYDRYGNRAVLAGGQFAGDAFTPTAATDTESAVASIYTTKNQWTGAGWDSGNGNMTGLFARTFAYL
jgi:YD repeat-containing protein